MTLLTPNMFMEFTGMSSRLLIRYRLVENRVKLMGEIGADNVYVTNVGPASDEVFDFRVQPSIYDQVFIRSAFDLADRGADVQLEVLVMRSLGKSRTLITRLSGRCTPAPPSGRSSSSTLTEVAGRLAKVHEEESTQSMSEAFKRHKLFNFRD